MAKTKYIHSNREEFLKTIHDMRETGIDTEIYISHDGTKLIELIKKTEDKYTWLSKNIVEGKNINNAGYQLINTRQGVKLVHRLVAMAWVENPYKLKNVGHKDLNKQHNCASNLFWTEQKLSMKHYYTHKESNTHKYYGRYVKSTQTFTDADGNSKKMTPKEYVEYRKENGLALTTWMKQYK